MKTIGRLEFAPKTIWNGNFRLVRRAISGGSERVFNTYAGWRTAWGRARKRTEPNSANAAAADDETVNNVTAVYPEASVVNSLYR